jgi:hypothetical protein
MDGIVIQVTGAGIFLETVAPKTKKPDSGQLIGLIQALLASTL